MALTATTIKTCKPKDKAYKLTDGGGLYLLVSPSGGKWWRFDYRFQSKRKTLSMGVYPAISLKDARDRRDEAKKQLANGIDPAMVRKSQKHQQSQPNTFEAVAREWHAKFKPGWSDSHANRLLRLLERDIFPWLGSMPVSDVSSPLLLQTIRRIETRSLDTAHRAMQNCGQVFRYAIATGRQQNDPTHALKGAIPPIRDNHFASITHPEQIGPLLRAIEGYKGEFITQSALRLGPLVFVRPGELRHAEWSEINLEIGEWRIPSEKMKMGQPHIVPLARQSIVLLTDLQPLTGTGQYLFPSVRSLDRPLSENTINAALRRLGYTKDEMTGHGFRSMASTLLNEQGWNRDHIERQLAHAERNKIRAAYNYADYLPERRKMMQAWADYLDTLKAV
jgi:integrase